MGRATFWAIFHITHLVTLPIGSVNGSFWKKWSKNLVEFYVCSIIFPGMMF
jgi:hypothetical protein